MAKIIETSTGALALTFDDVLLQPGHSEVMPGETDVRTRIAGDIDLNVPILSAAMDTVTEARLAIAMAQAGGIGVIHRNLTPEEQAEAVRQVKKFESGMVVNPVTIHPDATLADALTLMKRYDISGIPVVANGVFVSAGSLTIGARLLGVGLPPSARPGIALPRPVPAAPCPPFHGALGPGRVRPLDLWVGSATGSPSPARRCT